jgi:hypothetical protein
MDTYNNVMAKATMLPTSSVPSLSPSYKKYLHHWCDTLGAGFSWQKDAVREVERMAHKVAAMTDCHGLVMCLIAVLMYSPARAQMSTSIVPALLDSIGFAKRAQVASKNDALAFIYAFPDGNVIANSVRRLAASMVSPTPAPPRFALPSMSVSALTSRPRVRKALSPMLHTAKGLRSSIAGFFHPPSLTRSAIAASSPSVYYTRHASPPSRSGTPMMKR